MPGGEEIPGCHTTHTAIKCVRFFLSSTHSLNFQAAAAGRCCHPLRTSSVHQRRARRGASVVTATGDDRSWHDEKNNWNSFSPSHPSLLSLEPIARQLRTVGFYYYTPNLNRPILAKSSFMVVAKYTVRVCLDCGDKLSLLLKQNNNSINGIFWKRTSK